MKTARRVTAVILSLLLILSLAACSSGEKAAITPEYPLTILDVTLTSRPEKVVCSSALLTEVIMEIGLQDRLVGRPFDSTFEEIITLPAVGTAEAPSAMAIENLEPDLVILQAGAKQEDVDKLRTDGYSVLVLSPAVDRLSFRNLYACIGAAMAGARTGQERGLAAAERILIALDDIERLTLSEEKVNTVIFTDEFVTKCVTGDDITSMCIDLAGGFNVNIDKTGGGAVMDDIALSNPGVILCLEGTEALLHSKRELGTTDAFKNNRIYTYDVSKFKSMGSGLIVATWELARVLHPDLITPDMLPEGAVNYIVESSIVTFEPAE